jgi:taurine dioxygenase
MLQPFALHRLQNFGAAVTGLDLDRRVAPSVGKALYAAWLEHGILVFPGAGKSSENQIALSEAFGELEPHPVAVLRSKDNENIAAFGTPDTRGLPVMVDGERRAGYIYWHQDTAYTPNLCKGSVLRMVDVPARGGDTLWCDTAKAYDDLDESMKARVAKLETLQAQRFGRPPRRMWGMTGHHAVLLPDERGNLPPEEKSPLALVRHPMVVTHPESGRKSLLLSPLGFQCVLGLAAAEGDEFFNWIVAHAVQDKYCYRHHWSRDDMVLWDNRRTMHMALGYPWEMTRLGLRTTLKGHFPAGRYYEP